MRGEKYRDGSLYYDIVDEDKIIVDEYCSRYTPSPATFARTSLLLMPAADAPLTPKHRGTMNSCCLTNRCDGLPGGKGAWNVTYLSAASGP
jgi:hypothetical protein